MMKNDKDMIGKFLMLLLALISICCAFYAFILADYFFSLLLIITATFIIRMYRKGYYSGKTINSLHVVHIKLDKNE